MDRFARVGTCVLTEIPIWHKCKSGKVLFINSAYEQAFLAPRGYAAHDYLFRNDYAVWPPEIAAQFRANDRIVCERGIDIDDIENVEVELGIVVEMRIIKMCHAGGVFGAAIPAGMESHPTAQKIIRAVAYRKLARRERELTALLRGVDAAFN